MEKENNGNKGSYRPRRSDSRDDSRVRRNDSRDDSHARRDEREGKPAYGERIERKDDTRNRYGNNRTERYSERGQNLAPRSFNREGRESTGNNYQQRERGEDRYSPSRRDSYRGDDRQPRAFRERSDGNYGERNREERKPYQSRDSYRGDDRQPRAFRERSDGNYGERNREERKPYQNRDSYRGDDRQPRAFRERGDSNYNERSGGGERKIIRKRSDNDRGFSRGRREISGEAKERLRERHYSKKKILAHRLKNMDENAELRLNRFIAIGGVCSRRDADQLIAEGRVKVNGELAQVVGLKVRRTDKVEVDGDQIFPEKKVYLVLNKPKDYVTTVEDPLNRKTVMALIKGACKERVYPVGRLDRQTTGVLLFTNDGDLAKKLTHPKYDSKKIYHVFLDKPMSETDLGAISKGVDLEDGFIKADEISYASTDKMEVGLEIHSGKNRIVRRMFEHLGYEIIKLDRVYFSGLTKKNIPRGKWRMLTPKEVNMLKIY